MCYLFYDATHARYGTIFAVLWGLAGLFAALSNTICIYVLYRKEKHASKPIHRFLISLAVSDSMVGYIVYPTGCWLVLDGDGKWTSQAVICIVQDLNLFFTVYLLGASSFSIVIISYDRYLLLTKLTNYNLHMTPKKATILILTGWVLHLGLAIAGAHNFITLVWLSVTFYFVYLFVTVSCYSLIWRAVRQTERRLAASRKTRNASWSVANGSITTVNSPNHTKFAKKVVLMILCYMLVVIPVLSWLIFYVSGYSKHLSQDINIVYRLSTEFCALINSCLNPLVYLSSDAEFRRKFKNKFNCLKSTVSVH